MLIIQSIANANIFYYNLKINNEQWVNATDK